MRSEKTVLAVQTIKSIRSARAEALPLTEIPTEQDDHTSPMTPYDFHVHIENDTTEGQTDLLY
jgi:hypothetical protein